MSNVAFSARKDALSSVVINFLEGQPEGTKLTVAQIATQFGAREGGVSTSLRPAVQAGALLFDRALVEGKLQRVYLLPKREEEAVEDDEDGPLEITTDSTGDLWFSGHRVTTAGATLLSSKQIQQLVEFATNAPIDRVPAFKLEPEA